MNKTARINKRRWIDCLGPVEDLESYVKADWWRQIFNANYLRTDGDVIEDHAITRKEVDICLDILSPSEDNNILDLCCGQGRHSFELAERGFRNITGLDRSHYLITRARKLNLEKGMGVTFKEGDARNLPFAPDTFDYVLILGNSFGYFESLADDLKVLQNVLRVLKPSGMILIDLMDGKYMKRKFQARSWEWINKNYFVCRERSLSKDKTRIISREVITHVKKGVISDQFYAERLYSKEDISNLLESAGFEKISFNSMMKPASKRNQDLGMMGSRFVVSAMAKKKKWSPPLRAGKVSKNVVVILGDPRKTDVIKPNANFDEDDFFTINELKRALTELKDYKFTYLDQHDTLISKLIYMRQKIDFVFNLCDEGYFNEASKELHVPAFLEMLNLPYTGGTPQCLAYCYDKSLVRGIASEMDIPVPKAFLIHPEDVNFIEFPLQFPVIVKPNFGDSGFGITQDSVCFDLESLEKAIFTVREKFGYDKPILVEQFLNGKDISVGIIGNPPESYISLPIIEIDYSELPSDLPKICGYESKWLPESFYWKIKSVKATLPEATERYLIASCVRLFERLKCRDYARFDWRLDRNNTPRLLEVNPNPGWCWDGHLAIMAKIAGLSYPEMLSEILKACEQRLLAANAQNQEKLGSVID